jgi:hypothetical protein
VSKHEELGGDLGKWSRTLFAIGVTVPIGLAPLLGKLQLPGFDALLALLPEELQKPAVILGATAMSLVAASVVFRSVSKIAHRSLMSQARKSLWLAVVLLSALVLSLTFLTTRVHYGNGESHSFVTGFYQPNKPPCVDVSEETCLDDLTFSTSRISTYYGDKQIKAASVIILALYISFFAYFGNLIGVLIAVKKGAGQHRGQPVS